MNVGLCRASVRLPSQKILDRIAIKFIFKNPVVRFFFSICHFAQRMHFYIFVWNYQFRPIISIIGVCLTLYMGHCTYLMRNLHNIMALIDYVDGAPELLHCRLASRYCWYMIQSPLYFWRVLPFYHATGKFYD
jgi:hypothetical protein